MTGPAHWQAHWQGPEPGPASTSLTSPSRGRDNAGHDRGSHGPGLGVGLSESGTSLWHVLATRRPCFGSSRRRLAAGLAVRLAHRERAGGFGRCTRAWCLHREEACSTGVKAAWHAVLGHAHSECPSDQRQRAVGPQARQRRTWRGEGRAPGEGRLHMGTAQTKVQSMTLDTSPSFDRWSIVHWSNVTTPPSYSAACCRRVQPARFSPSHLNPSTRAVTA